MDRLLPETDAGRTPAQASLDRQPAGAVELEAAGDPLIVAVVLDGGGALGADRAWSSTSGAGSSAARPVASVAWAAASRAIASRWWGALILLLVILLASAAPCFPFNRLLAHDASLPANQGNVRQSLPPR
jgi:hypothetical protein